MLNINHSNLQCEIKKSKLAKVVTSNMHSNGGPRVFFRVPQ